MNMNMFILTWINIEKYSVCERPFTRNGIVLLLVYTGRSVFMHLLWEINSKYVKYTCINEYIREA